MYETMLILVAVLFGFGLFISIINAVCKPKASTYVPRVKKSTVYYTSEQKTWYDGETEPRIRKRKTRVNIYSQA